MTKAISKSVTIDLDEDAVNILPNAVTDSSPVALDGSSDVVDEDVNPLDKLPDDAVRNADKSVTLPLLYPVTIRTKKDGRVKEHKYEELTFHRLVGADQRAIAAASDAHTVIVSFSRSTRINQALMNALYDKLDLADISRCGQVLNFFVSNGRPTGA